MIRLKYIAHVEIEVEVANEEVAEARISQPDEWKFAWLVYYRDYFQRFDKLEIKVEKL